MGKNFKLPLIILAVFLGCYFLPLENDTFKLAIYESLRLVKWYAREHVVFCLLPAFFIAGAVSVFVSQASVMRYLGAGAKKPVAYGVASVSGTILAVCSCTILPLFAGIYRMGAGLGPATAFLYSGPAINILAIVMTARILGWELGVARVVGAVLFSVLIGLFMHFIFRKEEDEKAKVQAQMPAIEEGRPLWHTAMLFVSMVGILVAANFASDKYVVVNYRDESGISKSLTGMIITENTESMILDVNNADGVDERMVLDKAQILSLPVPCGCNSRNPVKWMITSAFGLLLALVLIFLYKWEWWKLSLLIFGVMLLRFVVTSDPLPIFVFAIVGFGLISGTGKGEQKEWFKSSLDFACLIMPLLFFGVFFAGIFLGAPKSAGGTGEGIIPTDWIANLVGGESISANLFASVAGAFMYFATLTEVPIVQGLLDNGMGKGPSLALLLAGPALSLPNMLVIRSVMGTKKTLVYVVLVVAMATFSGVIYGMIV